LGNRKYYLKNRDKILAQLNVYRQTPEYKAKRKEYEQRPEVRDKLRIYQQRPERKAKTKEYGQRPEVKAKRKEYEQTPERKAKTKEYKQRPEVKVRNSTYLKKYKQNNPEVGLKSSQKQFKKLSKTLGIFPFTKIPMIFFAWGKTIKKIHGKVCSVCSSITCIEAHHLFEKAKYPLLSLNENNGIPLCKECHDEIHHPLYIKEKRLNQKIKPLITR